MVTDFSDTTSKKFYRVAVTEIKLDDDAKTLCRRFYQTRDGDVLDAICAVHYGTENLSDSVTPGS